MKRRNLIKALPLATMALAFGEIGYAASPEKVQKPGKKPVLTIAHITDVHIRKGDNAPERFKKCLKEIVSIHKPDFFLNGGDTIHDASYDNVVREQVTEQWAVWDECTTMLSSYEVHSCIGNHDTWWAAPSKEDQMYGKDYVVKRLKIPKRYYSFSKKGWHFIVLDGNNKNITLDPEQFKWLEKELEELPQNTPVLLMSHYPILTVTNTWEGGQHGDHKELKQLFYKHKDKVKVCLSGHQHLLDRAWYNGIEYYCNGAMSGFWWGKGDAKSAKAYYYQETPPGYAILKLYEDGSLENTYIQTTL
ncbi:metallophosphoesterase family protein [Pedobacter nutrimenti]|uniref:Calcineurin-like phosphoesterase family protein n=1 Tax=Pedobacter nutrimenti TaxID=1241337 RepID=A0A318UCY8_9SPHI|nr:metallophosphoesterase [Pedobacter nutrimenti]PYF74302.1 calcineurin-like phosphoesterase family protein [Pedobacter nutrimenti]